MKDIVISLLEEGYSPGQIKDAVMWKGLLWSLIRRYVAGYGMTNARKVLCTKAFDEKGKSTTSVETHMQEGDISPTVLT